MSAVWVRITIPTKDFELKISENDKNLDSGKRLKNGINRSTS